LSDIGGYRYGYAGYVRISTWLSKSISKGPKSYKYIHRYPYIPEDIRDIQTYMYGPSSPVTADGPRCCVWRRIARLGLPDSNGEHNQLVHHMQQRILRWIQAPQSQSKRGYHCTITYYHIVLSAAQQPIVYLVPATDILGSFALARVPYCKHGSDGTISHDWRAHVRYYPQGECDCKNSPGSESKLYLINSWALP
jgi:hypothetical protein